MIALLALTCFLSKQEPVILIYWQPGMRYSAPTELDDTTLDTAIWSTGEVIWRDPAPVWARRNGEWSLQPAIYRRGFIEPKKVESAIAQLKKMSKNVIKNWGACIPDSHYTRIELRSGKWTWKMVSTDEPRENPPYGWEKVWKPGLQLWRQTRRNAQNLLPAKSKIIPRPKQTDWQRYP